MAMELPAELVDGGGPAVGIGPRGCISLWVRHVWAAPGVLGGVVAAVVAAGSATIRVPWPTRPTPTNTTIPSSAGRLVKPLSAWRRLVIAGCMSRASQTELAV